MTPEKIVFVFTPAKGGPSFKFRAPNNPKSVLQYLKNVLRLKTDMQVRAAGSWMPEGGEVEVIVRAPKATEARIVMFHFLPRDHRPSFDFRAPDDEAAVYAYLEKRGYDLRTGVLTSDAVPQPSFLTLDLSSDQTEDESTAPGHNAQW